MFTIYSTSLGLGPLLCTTGDDRHLAVKRRWAQLERLASKAGWRCAESGTYRVAGWANDATGEWMWEYPLDTAGS